MPKTTIKTLDPENALTGETGPRATQKDLFPERLERYGKAKTKALEILNHIVETQGDAPQHARLISDMTYCGNYLLFRDYYTIGEIRLQAALTCKKHLLCPLCAIRRGAKLVQDYHQRYESLRAENPLLVPYMVTFTVKDGPDLKERYSALREGLRKYHERRHRKNARCEALKAEAAVWSYEVKRGSGSGLWHPHVHAIWLCSERPSQDAVRAEWASIMGDGSFMVDVRPIDTTDPVGGFLEVFKYATKFSDQSCADTWHVFETLRGRRLIGSFGAFRGIQEPDNLNDELLAEELPYIDRLYLYGYGHYREHHLSEKTA